MSTKVNTEAPVPGMVPPLNRLVQIPGLKWLLLLIPLVYTAILLYYSMASVLKLSVYDDKGFTMQYLQQVFTEPLYLKVLWNTLKTSFIVMLVTLFISYPIAYLLVVMESERWKKVVLSLVMITLWISLLVRTFTWTVILQDQGIINKFLMSAGLISEPVKLMYNTMGVVIGMTHILIPYMVLSLYSVMEGIDRRLIQAAQGMGARPWKAFMQIFLPLSLPGVMSGSLIVFVLGIGYFVTPALLGGQGNMMISKLIQENIQMTLNWSMASAISVVLLVTTLILLGLAAWVARLSPLLKGEK
ncbi:ABC transporter permease [Aneurinibacillus uraniidurans]|uniref:ABC transporter permease n=1 Tax=Aneurinibacillus uraniidurans TaxID=2966586 RepID=UPI0023491B7E|nr:ABC transporter permease [Aneurinibacillus sp. B1]WCN36832.1 ABC transporter permease [Aneurinibacillus sp. B1]